MDFDEEGNDILLLPAWNLNKNYSSWYSPMLPVTSGVTIFKVFYQNHDGFQCMGSALVTTQINKKCLSLFIGIKDSRSLWLLKYFRMNSETCETHFFNFLLSVRFNFSFRKKILLSVFYSIFYLHYFYSYWLVITIKLMVN